MKKLILGKSIILTAALVIVAVTGTQKLYAQSAADDPTAPTVSVTDPIVGSNLSGVVTINADVANSSEVAGVQFYIDGSNVSTDTTAPYTASWNTDAATLGAHSLVAKAIIGTSNTNSTIITSDPVAVNVVDTTVPTVAITSPANSSQVSRNSNVTISATAFDNRAISKVEFYVNNVLKCTDTASAYTCNWTVPSGKGVRYAITARAYDTSGNATDSIVSVTSK
jgi:hypothetical protein